MFRFFSSLFTGFAMMVSSIFPGMSSTQTSQTAHQATVATQQQILTENQLLVMAGNMYADGNLPLGDKKYTTTNPQKGYIYLCNVQSGGGGAQQQGPWIHGNTWNIKQKIAVTGHVSWPRAQFANTLNGTSRTLSGNDLPSHTTGIFPIQSTDGAYAYDRNPNSIKTQSFTLNLPTNPTYSDNPYCMGGEVGVMTTGVALFNGFDAENRDAVANEVQDSCDGHPQESGEYHYHGLSKCITNMDETAVIGYALDGFPITGPKVATNKYLTTDNLDECHGITSEINLDGKMVTMYHYVMTEDFPYSVSCFRGKPVQMQVIQGQRGGQQSVQGGQNQPNVRPSGPQGIMQRAPSSTPPQAAFTVCSGKTTGATCSFIGLNGSTVTGTCQIPPNQTSLVCVPTNPPAGGRPQ